jgi:trans-aconitate 2-methyltransferase
MTRDAWDPKQYHRFATQRAQPFWDLVALLDPSPPQGLQRAVDLGCGGGELTAALAARLRIDAMLGIDRSPEMLGAARAHAGAHVRFERGDIGTWTGDHDHDLVIANASLHWVRDHAAVLARWIGALRPGGQLAVQVPANADHPSQQIGADVAAREPFASALGGPPPPDPVASHVLAPEAYTLRLVELGVAEPHVRLQVYPHRLGSTHDVVEWVRGASLTRFFERLPQALHEPFIEAYRAELITRVGHQAPYLYTFKRILMWGRV